MIQWTSIFIRLILFIYSAKLNFKLKSLTINVSEWLYQRHQTIVNTQRKLYLT